MINERKHLTMKTHLLVLPMVILLNQTGSYAETPELRVVPNSSSGRVAVDWQMARSHLAKPLALRLQVTDDFSSWRNIGPKIRLPSGAEAKGRLLETTLQSQAFYRLNASKEVEFSSSTPAAILGFASALEDQLELQGPMNATRFAELYTPRVDYLPQLTWDVTGSVFWEQFNTNYPWQWNRSGTGVIPGFELQMNPGELEVFRRNGFVVSSRLVRNSFADAYYDVFIRDLPVLITTDSILHAWHRSFDAILEDLEVNQLRVQLSELLDAMAMRIETLGGQSSGLARDGFVDADYIVGVARSLLRGSLVSSALGNTARTHEATSLVEWASSWPFQWLWGDLQLVDFSIFSPRGHYAKSESLSRYFRAMSWCGQCNLVVAGTNSTPRQISAALALLHALQDSGSQPIFSSIESALSQLVGLPDSMNFHQLQALALAEGIANDRTTWTSARLSQFANNILEGRFGFQEYAPIGLPSGGHVADQRLVPRVFSLFGQRFILDGWAMQEQLWPRITPELVNQPGDVRRRRSTSLDVAFTTFGNTQVVPELVTNMTTDAPMPFRDGFPYAHKLAAVKEVVDQVPEEGWRTSIYGSWLHALRSLSAPTTGPEFPEAMRTRAWAMKNLNTQLSSWTQLRHDTVLYAKATVSPPISCFYPDAFVEPYPEFYRRMSEMAFQTAAVTASLGTNWTAPGTAEGVQSFLRRFGTNCTRLREIALKELAQQPRNTEENAFLADLVEQSWNYNGDRQFKGWYPLMFYRGAEGQIPCQPFDATGRILCPDHDSALEDFAVSDIQSDEISDADSDPGAILHQGIGKVRFLRVAFENGPDRVMYMGPVYSHYEFWTPYGVRQSDEEWKETVKQGGTAMPVDPPWTHSFLR